MPLFVCLFLFVFGWKVTEFVDLISLTSLLLVLYWYGQRGRGLPGNQLAIVVSLGLAAAYAATVVTLTGGEDPQVALRAVRALLALLAGLALVGMYGSRFDGEALRVLVAHLYFVIGLHAMIICVMYLNDDLRTWVYDAIGTLDYVNANAPVLLGLRVTGLTYGLASTSITQFAGLILLLPVLSMNRGRKWLRLAAWLMVPAIVAALFLTGRSGLAMAAVALPTVLALGFITGHGGFRGVGLATGVVACIIGLLLVSGYLDSLFPQKLAYNVERASEILQLLDDPARSPTFLAVREMYFLPRTDLGFLFGSGSLGRGDVRYIPSDVGVILLIFSVGVVGLLLTVLPFLIGLNQVAMFSTVDWYLRISASVVLIASLVFSFKELALLTRNMWSVQVILIGAVTLVSNAGVRKFGSGTYNLRDRANSVSIVH